mmetsp:Transcript_66375/g.209893  ORF Transcript_66375/g.209893 Transcript_66375/m.209893 type:complete len:643 (-) Transcript_66375:262-2190(-)
MKKDRVLILTALWLGALCCSIWFSTEKTVECCAQAAAFLGCAGIPLASAPCLTATSEHLTCRALVNSEDELEGFVCNAFPDGSIYHVIILTMIIFVVILPVDIGLASLIEMSNSASVPDRWISKKEGPLDRWRRERKGIPHPALSVGFLEEEEFVDATQEVGAGLQRSKTIGEGSSDLSSRLDRSVSMDQDRSTLMNRSSLVAPEPITESSGGPGRGHFYLPGAAAQEWLGMSSGGEGDGFDCDARFDPYYVSDADVSEVELDVRGSSDDLPIIGAIPFGGGDDGDDDDTVVRFSGGSWGQPELGGALSPGSEGCWIDATAVLENTEERDLESGSPRGGRADFVRGVTPEPAGFEEVPSASKLGSRLRSSSRALVPSFLTGRISNATANIGNALKSGTSSSFLTGRISNATANIGNALKSGTSFVVKAGTLQKGLLGRGKKGRLNANQVRPSNGEPARPRGHNAAKARFKMAARVVGTTAKLNRMQLFTKAAREAYDALLASVAAIYLITEISKARKRQIVQRCGIGGVIFTWAAFTYFIFVYGVKLYDQVAPGAELEFIKAWLSFLLMDNFVFCFKNTLKNVMIMQIITIIQAVFISLVDPFVWFEKFDDGVFKDTLETDVKQMDTMDMEALDILSNPFGI